MGVQAQPRGHGNRLLRVRNPSGGRAPVGGWERHGGLLESDGIPALLQLRSVGNPSVRNPPSRRWFALVKLCKVEPVLAVSTDRISRVFGLMPNQLSARIGAAAEAGRTWSGIQWREPEARHAE